MLPNLKPSTPHAARLTGFPSLVGEDEAGLDNSAGRDSSLGWNNDALSWDRGERDRAIDGADQERSHRQRDERDRDRDRERHERDRDWDEHKGAPAVERKKDGFYPHIPQTRAGSMSGMAPPMPPQRTGYKMETKPKKRSKAKKSVVGPPQPSGKKALPNFQQMPMGMSVVSSSNYGALPRNAPMSISGNNYGAPSKSSGGDKNAINPAYGQDGGYYSKPAKKKPSGYNGYSSYNKRGAY
jgi:hypothetical protein